MKVYRTNRFGLGELGRSSGRPPRSDRNSPEKGAEERRDAKPASKVNPKVGREPRRSKDFATGKTKGRRPLAALLSVLMVVAGLGVVGYSVFGGSILGIANSIVNPAPVPTDNEFTLTVPKMSRVAEDPVFTASASDAAMLDRGAVHVEGTGYPWDEEANVYIAAHRLGYAGTDSFLQFYDLNKLKDGDEIVLTDSNGTEYTYTVFNRMRVLPTDSQVLQPTPGENIVSLQTCTLPDYSHRLIVQGQLTSVA